MFELGKCYRVKMWEGSDEGGVITEYAPAQVVEVSLPLVKFKGSTFMGDGETILNTAALAFVSAAIAMHD